MSAPGTGLVNPHKCEASTQHDAVWSRVVAKRQADGFGHQYGVSQDPIWPADFPCA